MTDYEKYASAASPRLPDLPLFDDWEKENQFDDPSQAWINYGNFVRSEYYNKGVLNRETEGSIRQGVFSALVRNGHLKGDEQDAFYSLIEQPEVSDEEKEALIQGQFNNPDGKTWDDYKRSAVNEGSLPFAKVEGPDGEPMIIAGKGVEGISALEAIDKSSKYGGLNMSDLYYAQHQLQNVGEGEDIIPLWKYNEISAAYSRANILLTTDYADVDRQLKRLRNRKNSPAYESMSEEERSELENEIKELRDNLRTRHRSDIVNSRLSFDGTQQSDSEDDEFLEKLGTAVGKVNDFVLSTFSENLSEEQATLGYSNAEATSMLKDMLNYDAPEGQEVSDEVASAVYETLSLERANADGKFRHYEGEEAGRNLRFNKMGMPVISTSTLVSDESFNETLQARPELSLEVKELLQNQRLATLNQNYDTYSRLFWRTKGEDWLKFEAKGIAEGLDNNTIIRNFTADSENYNTFLEVVGGIYTSAVDGYISLGAAIPAMAFDHDVSKQLLVDMAQRSSDRRQLAQAFNQSYGLIREAGEAVVPVAIDLAATTLLATVTAPAGGVAGTAYVAAKAGSAAMVKAVVKGASKKLISTAPSFLRKGAAKGESLEELLKVAVKEVDAELAVDVMKAYNKSFLRSAGIQSAIFVPAATRSGASTYGSVTRTLQEEVQAGRSNMSPEEIHDAALGAGMASGLATAIITTSFNIAGMGGIEAALYRGMTFKQFKTLMETTKDFAKTLPDAQVAEVLRKVVNEGLTKGGVVSRIYGVTKPIVGEGLEEGLDEFVNSFITDIYTDQNTPILDKFVGAMNAAAVGGIIGTGVPIVRKVARKSGVSRQIAMQQAAELQRDIFAKTYERVKESGSPLTAEVLRSLFETSQRLSGRPALEAEAPTATEAEQQELDFETGEVPAETGEVPAETAEVPAETAEVPVDTTPTATEAEQQELDFEQEEVDTVLGDAASDPQLKQRADSIVPPTKLPTDSPEVEQESPKDSGPALQYIEDPDSNVFKSGEVITDEEQQALESVLDLATDGFPLRFSSSEKYGVPFTGRSLNDKSDFLAKKIYSRYPVVVVEGKTNFSSSRSVSRFNPITGKKEKGKVKGHLDQFGNGVFNNDPVVMAEMLAHEIHIEVPKEFNMFDLNPAIRVDNGVVIDVVGPSTDRGPVSKVGTSPVEFAEVKVDYQQFANFPFLQKGVRDVEMPYGTRTVNRNGVTQDVSDAVLTYGEVTDAVAEFFAEASGTGVVADVDDEFFDGRKSGTGVVKQILPTRLRNSFDNLDEVNRELAMLEAQLEYDFLLRLFEIRGVLESDRMSRFIGGKTVKKNGQRAVKKLITERTSGTEKELVAAMRPFIKGDPKTNTATITAFVEQQVLSNPLFDANSMPSLAEVVTKRVKRYVGMEQHRGMLSDRGSVISEADFEDGLSLDHFSDGLGMVAPESDEDGSDFYEVTQSAVDNAIDTINQYPDIRKRLNELYIEAVSPNAPASQVEWVSRLSTEDLMVKFGTYLGTGSHTNRPQVLEFVKNLEEASMTEAGYSIKDALYLNFLSYRYEGNPMDGEIVQEVRRLLSSSSGKTVSETRAKNFIKAMDESVRKLHSRTVVSEVERVMIERQNAVDLERLGLKSGDPESVVQALKIIAETSDNPSHKLVADLLLEDEAFLKSVEIQIGPRGDELNNIAGEYNFLTDGTHHVFINTRTGNGLGLENILLEEYVHAFLSGVSNKPESELTPNQKSALTRLRNLYTLAKETHEKSGTESNVLDNAFENFDEFLAKFLLSPRLQSLIKAIKTPKGQQGFFDRITDALLSMFRKVTGSEKKIYKQALKDIISLSKSPNKSAPSSAEVVDGAMRVINQTKSIPLPAAARGVSLDDEYMSAVESGDVRTQQKLVDESIQDSNYKAKGARAGVYRDSVPLMPSASGLLGSGYYAILDGTKEDVREFAGPIASPERLDTSLESRVDNVAIDLGSNPLFLDSTQGINQFIREKGLTEAFEAWESYQETVNSAYKAVGTKRPDSLEARRGSKWATRPDANFLLDRGFASAIIVDHSKEKGTERSYKEVVVANPAQIKSREPITRDANGNVIPLSQRFDKRRDNILYASTLSPDATAEQKDQNDLDAQVDNLSPENGKPSPKKKKAKEERTNKRLGDLMAHLKRRLPYGVKVERDDDSKNPMYVVGDTIYINPRLVLAETRGFDALGARAYMEVLLFHELSHVASFNALTQAEINALISSLGEVDYIQIANTYFQGEQNREAREEAIRLVSLEVGPETDEDVVEEINTTKFILAEELIRIHSEKMVRGTTTEEDHEFWESKPSLFKILREYIRRYFTKLVEIRRVRRGSRVLDSLLVKVHNELTLIELGIVRSPQTPTFDVNNPTEAAQLLARSLSYDPLEDIANEQDGADFMVRLAAARRVPVDFVNRLMERAGLEMGDGSEFVDVEASDPVVVTEENLELRPSDAPQWTLPRLSKDVKKNLSLGHGLIPLSKFKSLLGVSQEDTPSDILRGLPQAFANEVTDLLAGVQTEKLTIPVITFSLDEEGLATLVPLTVDNEASISQSDQLGASYAVLISMIQSQSSGDTMVPVSVGYDTRVPLEDAVESEYLLHGLLQNATPIEINNPIPELNRAFGMPVTQEELQSNQLDFEAKSFTDEHHLVRYISEFNGGEKLSRSTFDPLTGMDHDLLVKLIRDLSSDSRIIEPTLMYDELAGVDSIDVSIKDRDGNLLASVDSILLRSNGTIEVGGMYNVTNTLGKSSASSFGQDLIAQFAVNAPLIRAKTINTVAGGGGNFAIRQAAEDYNDFIHDLRAKRVDEDGDTTEFTERNSVTVPEAGMTGYFTWPRLGFEYINNPTFEQRSRLQEEALNNLKTAPYSGSLSQSEARLAEKKIEEIISNVNKVTKDDAEFLDYKRGEDGKLDLLELAQDREDGKRAMRAWRNIGLGDSVTFDLTAGSRNLKFFVKSFISPRLKKVDKLSEIITEFKREMARPEADEDSIREKANNRAREEAGIRFKLFSLGRSSTPTTASLDFAAAVEMLELPMAEYETYKSPSNFLSRLFVGDVGNPVKDFIDQRDQFKRASIDIVKRFQKELAKIIERDGVELNETNLKLIAEAQGYVDGNIVSEDFYEKTHQDHKARKKAINESDMDEAAKKAARKASRVQRDSELNAAEEVGIEAAERRRDEAVRELAKISTDLSVLIVSARKKVIQPLQKVLSDLGLSKDIKARIDQTAGIYITRSYRIFNDPTFAQKVREDAEYHDVRQAAMDYFEDSLRKQGGEEAVRKANKDAGGRSYAQNMLEGFISSYDGVVSGNPASDPKYSKRLKNLSKRLDLPKSLRDLLGEYGPETGTDLILRTLSTVANLTAEQAFRTNLAKLGKAQGFLVDYDEYRANPDQYIELKPSANRNDPLANLYAKKEVAEDLRSVVTPDITPPPTGSSARLLSKTAGLLQNLTGKSMLFNTLGSAGFFLRNIAGNALFFGPAQGLPASMSSRILSDAVTFSISNLRDPDRLDSYLTELVSLGVIGDELRAGMVKELLDGTSPNEKFELLNNLIESNQVTSKIKGGIESLETALTGLSASIDGSYKIAYYEYELDYLREAKEAYPDSDIGQMSDVDLKKMASKKVKATAQSLSQAPPLVRALSKSSFGILFSPFIRFKAEMPRIVIGTYRLANQEKASNNPMIQQRGKARFKAMSSMLFIGSAALPLGLAAFAGIGSDEDEALRKSMPRYLRGHTFWYLNTDDGLFSLDLTYLNPFSLLTDPVLRAFENLYRGDIGTAVSSFVSGLVFDQYLDEQILAGAVSDVVDNRDATTDDPIYIEEVDGLGGTLTKQLKYIYEKAYEPRFFKDSLDAYESFTNGREASAFVDSPLGELLDGVYPVKTHRIDAEKQFRRYIFGHTSNMRSINKQLSQIYSGDMSDEDIRGVYRGISDGRHALNSALYRVSRGFESLGVGYNTQSEIMINSGVGKRKTELLLYGVMDRVGLSDKFLDNLKRRGLQQELNTLILEKINSPQYRLLDD